jgi:hypothetical protein
LALRQAAYRLQLFLCAPCRGLHILVQSFSINSVLVLIICKERAGNIVFRVADTRHLQQTCCSLYIEVAELQRTRRQSTAAAVRQNRIPFSKMEEWSRKQNKTRHF